ncbi:MAG: carboxypeptidase regulatory-like domain-containing protein [Actinomycetales bacterium]
MRVTSNTPVLDVDAGGRAAVTVSVVNTSDVIDGISARIVGIPEQHVTSEPALLPLFPEDSGDVTLRVGLPPTFPAGRHPLTVEVRSQAVVIPPQHVDLDLVVPARPALKLTARPEVVRARRHGRFVLELANRGNVPLEVALHAADADRSMRLRFTPETLTVPAGAVATAVLEARSRWHIFGGDLGRPVTVETTGTHGEQSTDDRTVVTLRQRALIPRGLLTVLILAAIVGLWAAAFLFGLTRVFSGDPLTKTAPASFFISSSDKQLVADDGLPAKDGALPAGAGGSIAGTVSATTTGEPVGRIVVEALRQSREGLVLVGSAASQVDGSFVIPGLFPGDYLLRFSATGYRTTWWPGASAQAAAKPVTAVAQRVSSGVNVALTGLPGSIRGTVDPGDSLTPVVTTVTARALQTRSGATAPAVTTKSRPDGSWALNGLPAPGTYEVSFTTPGYATTTVVEKVGGGQQRYVPTVRLSAGDGTISGTVTAAGQALGGVTVTTTVDGKSLTTATPTQGVVGQFVLTGLPTPSTYVVTLSKDGYGSQTVVVDLGPGQVRKDLAVTLQDGTGSVTGLLTGSDGQGIGDATVTVGGVAKPVATQTLTTGDVGRFAISGLRSPGSYTLTFSKKGYVDQTVPVTLGAAGPPPTVDVVLPQGLGSIAGTVTAVGSGSAVSGAQVSVTDGSTTWTTTTVGGAGATGGSYLAPDLRPGHYAVTVTADGYLPATGIAEVTAGGSTTLDIGLRAS